MVYIIPPPLWEGGRGWGESLCGANYLNIF
jgi:hypothetical protein